MKRMFLHKEETSVEMSVYTWECWWTVAVSVNF